MLDSIRAAQGQNFVAGGLRANLVKYVDAFLLAIVQLGEHNKVTEVAILGLARLRLPEKGHPIAYVELSVLLDVKIKDKVATLEAELTPNSWALDKDCQLTGGFAFMYWWGDDHKGDFVVTLGGYHPRFQRPTYYPAAKRIGFNWPIDDHLKAKGGAYFALTPNAIMAGARFEGTFNSGIVGASLTAYFDCLVEWDPLYWQLSAGFTIKAWADLALFTIHLTLGVDATLMGQPVHGILHLKIGPISITIRFGSKSSKPPRVKAWPRFGRTHLVKPANGKTHDTSATGVWAVPTGAPVDGPAILTLRIGQGDATKPGGKAKPARDWSVRADELSIVVASVIPATEIEVGRVSGDTWPTGFPEIGQTQDHNAGTQTLVGALAVERAATEKSQNALGLRPMGIKSVQTPMRVTVFRHVKDGSDVSLTVQVEKWRHDVDRSNAAAAVWDTKPLDTKLPSSKMIKGVLSGLKSLQPPIGGPRGASIGPVQRVDLGWDELRKQAPVPQRRPPRPLHSPAMAPQRPSQRPPRSGTKWRPFSTEWGSTICQPLATGPSAPTIAEPMTV